MKRGEKGALGVIPETRTDFDVCMVCGRELPLVASWGPDWLRHRYCSPECSERRLAPLDYLLQDAIERMLGERSARRILRLSDVARAVDPIGWESLMERALNAARRLTARGELVIEGFETEGALLFGGDVRLRLPH